MNCWSYDRADAALRWMGATRVPQIIAVPTPGWGFDFTNIISRRTGDKFYGLSFEFEDAKLEEKDVGHLRDLISEIRPGMSDQEWFQDILIAFLEEICVPEMEILWPQETNGNAVAHWDIKEKGYVAEKVGERRYIITPKHFLFQFGLPLCVSQYGDYRINIIPKDGTRINFHGFIFYYSYEPNNSRREILHGDYVFKIDETRELFIICGQPVVTPRDAWGGALDRMRTIVEYSEDGVRRYTSSFT